LERRKNPAPARPPKLDGHATVNHDHDYTDEEREFLMAMDQYKRAKSRPFPTLCEVLEVLRSLGYRKTS
jgi:hypothetical protein